MYNQLDMIYNWVSGVYPKHGYFKGKMPMNEDKHRILSHPIFRQNHMNVDLTLNKTCGHNGTILDHMGSYGIREDITNTTTHYDMWFS